MIAIDAVGATARNTYEPDAASRKLVRQRKNHSNRAAARTVMDAMAIVNLRSPKQQSSVCWAATALDGWRIDRRLWLCPVAGHAAPMSDAKLVTLPAARPEADCPTRSVGRKQAGWRPGLTVGCVRLKSPALAGLGDDDLTDRFAEAGLWDTDVRVPRSQAAVPARTVSASIGRRKSTAPCLGR